MLKLTKDNFIKELFAVNRNIRQPKNYLWIREFMEQIISCDWTVIYQLENYEWGEGQAKDKRFIWEFKSCVGKIKGRG